MKRHCYFVLPACIFSFIRNLSAQACDEGWFGPECQFKCHCRQLCRNDGECPDKCEEGWIGYKCQHRLNKYKAKSVLYEDDDFTTILSDDNNTTCLELEDEAIIIDLETFGYNPWIRLVTKRPDQLFDLKITYLNEDLKPAKTFSKDIILVRDNAIDIHNSIYDDIVTSITFEGVAIDKLCDLYVSKGQNVALKQNVYYSNSNILGINTDLPQYPQASDGILTCNKSDTEIAGTNWEIVINPSFLVKEILFHVNDTLGVYRQSTINQFDNEGNLLLAFNSELDVSYPFYGLVTWGKEPKKAFTLAVTSSPKNKSVSLLLCEVEVYMDCKKGTWGIHCNNTCNNNCPEMCRFDDGLCNDRCVGHNNLTNCTRESAKPGEILSEKYKYVMAGIVSFFLLLTLAISVVVLKKKEKGCFKHKGNTNENEHYVTPEDVMYSLPYSANRNIPEEDLDHYDYITTLDAINSQYDLITNEDLHNGDNITPVTIPDIHNNEYITPIDVKNSNSNLMNGGILNVQFNNDGYITVIDVDLEDSQSDLNSILPDAAIHNNEYITPIEVENSNSNLMNGGILNVHFNNTGYITVIDVDLEDSQSDLFNYALPEADLPNNDCRALSDEIHLQKKSFEIFDAS